MKVCKCEGALHRASAASAVSRVADCRRERGKIAMQGLAILQGAALPSAVEVLRAPGAADAAVFLGCTHPCPGITVTRRCLPSPGSWGVPIRKPPTLVYIVRAAVRCAATTDFDDIIFRIKVLRI